MSTVNELIERAAAGVLPEWAEVTPRRQEHMSRVATLLAGWADALGLGPADRVRWSATGWLHDALRDAPAEQLRPWVGDRFIELPDAFLHGPAAAGRLVADGLADDDLLDAIRYHTLGHARLGQLGLALIAADFLEPGRPTLAEWRARQRDRMPGELDAVVTDVVGAKLGHSIETGTPLRQEMVGMWNWLVRDEA